MITERCEFIYSVIVRFLFHALQYIITALSYAEVFDPEKDHGHLRLVAV